MTTGAPATRQPGPGMDGQPAGGFVLRLLLGAQLRRFREAADITPNRAGYEIRASRSKVSRMESGHVGFKTRDIDDLLTLYGVSDEQERSRILSVAAQASQPDWWSKYSDVLPNWFENYLGLESAAPSRICRMWSTPSNSPVPCTWNSAQTSSTTWKSWIN